MEYRFRSNKIITLGDSHSVLPVIKNMEKVPEGSDVFHVGDLGLGFYSRNIDMGELAELSDLCVKKDIEFYAIRGNHDKPSMWYHETFDFPNIHLVKDYSKFVFPNEKTALAVGGAISVDRYGRTYLLDYWDGEATEPPQYKLDKFDFVFMHDAPNCFNHSTESLRRSFPTAVSIDSTLLSDCHKQRGLMDRIVADTECRYVVGGHYHNSNKEKKDGVKYRCVDINELWEFNANE